MTEINFSKQFTVINEDFSCEFCKHDVKATQKGTPRDHCPHCLCSKHVDINPGDRANRCHGQLKPVAVINDAKKGYIIVYQCLRCDGRLRNKAAADDNFDLLLKLSANPLAD